jgi:hypothetical protein
VVVVVVVVVMLMAAAAAAAVVVVGICGCNWWMVVYTCPHILPLTCSSHGHTHAHTHTQTVSKKLLEHGVTGYCPTIITSPPSTYEKLLPQLKRSAGGRHGAAVLGAHLEVRRRSHMW